MGALWRHPCRQRSGQPLTVAPGWVLCHICTLQTARAGFWAVPHIYVVNDLAAIPDNTSALVLPPRLLWPAVSHAVYIASSVSGCSMRLHSRASTGANLRYPCTFGWRRVGRCYDDGSQEVWLGAGRTVDGMDPWGRPGHRAYTESPPPLYRVCIHGVSGQPLTIPPGGEPEAPKTITQPPVSLACALVVLASRRRLPWTPAASAAAPGTALCTTSSPSLRPPESPSR